MENVDSPPIVPDTQVTLLFETFRKYITPREFQVLNAIVNGNSNKDAARLLGISPRTIEVHRFSIIDKLNKALPGQVRNTCDMMRVAMMNHYGELKSIYQG